MTEVERIQRYIVNTKIHEKFGTRYSMRLDELFTFSDMLQKDIYRTMGLIFDYGAAKGYRAAMKGVKKHE